MVILLWYLEPRACPARALCQLLRHSRVESRTAYLHTATSSIAPVIPSRMCYSCLMSWASRYGKVSYFLAHRCLIAHLPLQLRCYGIFTRVRRALTCGLFGERGGSGGGAISSRPVSRSTGGLPDLCSKMSSLRRIFFWISMALLSRTLLGFCGFGRYLLQLLTMLTMPTMSVMIPRMTVADTLAIVGGVNVK